MTYILKFLQLNLEEIFTTSGISKYKVREYSAILGWKIIFQVCARLHFTQTKIYQQGLKNKGWTMGQEIFTLIFTVLNKKCEPWCTWEAELWQSNKINVLWNCHIFYVRCFLLPVEALDIFNPGSLFFLSEGAAFAFAQVITSMNHLNIISADKRRHKYWKNFWIKGRKISEFSLSAL